MRYVKIDIYFANICKHEHEKNMKRLWCKIVLKTDVEQIFLNEGVLLLFIHFWGLKLRKLPRKFLCVHQIIFFLENLLN